MITLYWAALIVGLGIVLLQLLFSSHGDADVDASGEVELQADAHADLDVDAHADLDTDADLDADAHGGAHHGGHAGGAGILPIFLSIRFWTFALLAFGMVGAVLGSFALAAPTATLVAAVAMGLASGLAASWTFRLLARTQTTSGAQSRDVVGQSGRIIVPPGPGGRCKIRVQVMGQTLDLMARADPNGLGEGDSVLIVGMEDNVAQVAPLPEGLGPKSEQQT